MPEFGAWINFHKPKISRMKYLFWEVHPPGFGFSVRVKQESKLHAVLHLYLLEGLTHLLGSSKNFRVRERGTAQD